MLTSTFPNSIWFCCYQGRSFRNGAGLLVKLSSPHHNLIPQRLTGFPHQSQLCFTSEMSQRRDGALLAERDRGAASLASSAKSVLWSCSRRTGAADSTNAWGGQKWVEGQRTGHNTSTAASGQPNNAVYSSCLMHLLVWGLSDVFLLSWWNPSADPAKLRNIIWIERICHALPQNLVPNHNSHKK